MVRVGLVGCGAIGARLAEAIERRYQHSARLVAVHDRDPRHAERLIRRLRRPPRILTLPQLLRASQLILEAASVDAAAQLVPAALALHRDILVMSVGGLLASSRWKAALATSRGRVFIPSGALSGLDGIKAMAVGRIHRLTLTTSKPPRSLASAPYVLRKRLRLTALRRPMTVFQGTPRQAIAAFPQNTNVAAALALAGGRAGARARVRVVADPSLRRNVHEVTVSGDCGEVVCRVESRPSANPKTSELAVRSAVATLDRLFSRVQLGT